MLRQDLKFQFRHGFYLIYGVITAVYIIILMFIPANNRPIVSVFLIFSDTAVLGFFFVGGIVLLERSEQLLESLFISPLTVSEYMLSKIISLGILSLICSTAILIPSGIHNAARITIIVFGILISSFLFICIGMGMAVKVKSVNQYFLWSMSFMILFVPAILEAFGVFTSPLIYIIPVRGVLEIIRIGISETDSDSLVLPILSVVPWLAVSFTAVRKIIITAVIQRGGDKTWIHL